MRILIISSKFPFPLKDGGAIATFSLVSGLAKLNNQVFILSFNTQKHFINTNDIPDVFTDKINYSLVYSNTRPGFFSAGYNLVFSKLPYIQERLKSRKFDSELVRILKGNRFDVIQIEGLYMLQYVQTIRANSNASISYRPHNVESQIWDNLSLTCSGVFKKLYYKILTNRILRYELSLLNNYDLILPISEEDACFFNQSGNKRPCLVVPTGFEIQNKEHQLIEMDSPSIYFIGSLEWRPNQEGILWFLENCWEHLLLKFPNLKWYIAGRNAPDNLARRFAVSGIVWAGEIENASEFCKDKSIMVVPLLSGSGMRIKIIEAFVNVKPVVSTTLGARGTLAKNNDNILLADSKEEFIAQISRLLEQVQLYKKIAFNGHEHATKAFDNNIISGMLTEFYKQQTYFKNSVCQE